MAGTASKVSGSLLLTLGSVMMLAGGGAATYGFVDEGENDAAAGSLGVAADSQRSETNGMWMAYGLLAGGIGVLLTALAVVLLAVGGSRERVHLMHLAHLEPAAHPGVEA